MNTANLPPFDGLLQKVLRCSRYARHVLEADPSLLNWLQENYLMPCDRAEMQALLQQSSPSPHPPPDALPPTLSRERERERTKEATVDSCGGGSNRVADATDSFDSEAGLTCAVRKLRKQVMVKLILRDLNGLAGLNEVMQAMTALAEVCV